MILQSIKNGPRLAYFLSLGCLLWLFILTFGTATGTDIEGEFINSDTLYLPSLYWDIFENGSSISDWNLNPAPNFFPDMLFYFLLMKLTGNLLVSSFLFSIIQLIVMNLLFHTILKKISSAHYELMITGNFLLAFFALAELVSDKYLFVFYFLSNPYHLGSFILTLLSVNLILAYRETGKILNLIILFLMCVLGVMSDKLFLVGLTFPIIALYSIYVLPKWKLKRDWLVFGVTILASVGGVLLLRVLTHNKVIFIDAAHSFLNIENIFPSLLLLLKHYEIYFFEFNIISLIMFLSLISLILLTIYCIKLVRSGQNYPQQQKLAILFLWFTITFVLVSPVAAGNYTGFDTIRYNYHSYIFLLVILPFLVFQLVKKPTINIISGLSLFMLVIAAFLFGAFSKYNFTNYFQLYPKKAQTADAYSRKTGLKTGTGGYWDAKLITMFSKNKVIILPASTNLGFYDHATNRSWCHYRPGIKKEMIILEFAIIDPIDSSIIADVFKPFDLNFIQFNGLTFVNHPNFVYNRDRTITIRRD